MLLTFAVQKEFDSREVLQGVFDFVTCQRPDGSYYGNGGGACHKGSQSQLPDKTVDKTLSARISKAFDKYATGIEKMNSEASIEELKDITLKVQETADDFEQKIKDGTLTFEEFEDYLINGYNDIGNADFVIRGMEPGAQGIDTDEARIKTMARDMASSKIERELKTDTRVTDLLSEAASADGGLKPGFSKSALTDSKAMEDAGRGWASTFSNRVRPLIEEVDPSKAAYGSPHTVFMSTASKTVDNLPMRGLSIGDKSFYQQLPTSDPRFKGVSNRQDVIDKYGRKRDQVFMKQLNDASKSNPSFRGGFAAPGSGKAAEAKWSSYESLAKLHQESGGKVYKMTYNGADSKAAPAMGKGAQNVPVLAYQLSNGKYFVAANTSVSKQSWNQKSMADIFTTTESRAKAGQLSEWKAPAKKDSSKSAPKRAAKTASPKRAAAPKPSSAPKPQRTAEQRTAYIKLRQDALKQARQDKRSGDVARIEQELRILGASL